jgi:hypothetical protein
VLGFAAEIIPLPAGAVAVPGVALGLPPTPVSGAPESGILLVVQPKAASEAASENATSVRPALLLLISLFCLDLAMIASCSVTATSH